MTMLPLINAVLLTLSVLALLPVLAFCLETVLALLPRKELHWPRGSPRPRAAVLIPAHNEELLLQQTLAAILPTLAPGDRVLVVADNCDDQTAEVSRRAGAEAVERSDPSRRGKGYALDYGLRALSQDPPDVVVVIDADCLLAAETVDLLARVAGSTLRPVQALNLTDRNPPAGPVQTVSTLANRFTNLIRPLGLARVNMPCRLMGTGMAIPWAIRRQSPSGRGQPRRRHAMGNRPGSARTSPAVLPRSAGHQRAAAGGSRVPQAAHAVGARASAHGGHAGSPPAGGRGPPGLSCPAGDGPGPEYPSAHADGDAMAGGDDRRRDSLVVGR